jgi:hypothetical protein
MSQINIKNLEFIRKVQIEGHPEFGARLYETLNAIIQGQKNIGLQTNASLNEPTPPPPQINNLEVSASGGVAHVSIADDNEIYRGVSYHVQYSKDAAFSSPITVHMGPSRDIRIPVGSDPLYYRAFSDYPTSAPSTPVYHGGTTPVAIAAQGSNQPSVPSGKGSGTGTSGQISGWGPIPFRSTTGAPPERQ